MFPQYFLTPTSFIQCKRNHECLRTLINEEFKMSQKEYYVYILASQKYGTLYIGITSNLLKRVYQHKEGLVAGFTKKYHCISWFIMRCMEMSMRQFYVKNK